MRVTNLAASALMAVSCACFAGQAAAENIFSGCGNPPQRGQAAAYFRCGFQNMKISLSDVVYQDLLDLHAARVVEAADRFDRGIITSAQLAVEEASAARWHTDAIHARNAARASQFHSAQRSYQPQPIIVQPAAPSAPRTIDCSITPGSLGRSVSCW